MTRPLISVSEFRELPTHPVVLDIRYKMGDPQGHADYVRGHIPGAAYVDLESDLADPPGQGGRHPLPEPARFEAAMRRAGVLQDAPVVVYDDWSGHAAARAWWLLRHHGHEEVRVLDGGWTAWCTEGGEVATGDHQAPLGNFTLRPGRMRAAEADEMLALAERGVLIDARAAERYRGETEPIDPVAGRIPGAVNVPTSSNIDERGRFRPAEELRELYASVGAVDGAEVAAYCGSGVTAAHDVLALASIGIDAALYPGSWSGWITDPKRPVATG